MGRDGAALLLTREYDGQRARWEGSAPSAISVQEAPEAEDARATFDLDEGWALSRQCALSFLLSRHHWWRWGTVTPRLARMSDEGLTPRVSRDDLQRERRDIILRDNSNWDQYGIGPEERERWIAAGVPENRATFAAIALHVGDDDMELLGPRNLNESFGDTTPLRLLLAGHNSAVIEDRIMQAVGGPLGQQGMSWMQVVKEMPNPNRLTPAMHRRITKTDTHPSFVPDVHEHLSNSVLPDSPRRFALALMAKAADQLIAGFTLVSGDDNDFGAGLFNTYAASHGIAYEDDETRLRLAYATPRDPGLEASIDSSSAFADYPGRYLFHVDPEQHRALREAAEMQTLPQAFDPSRLPAETGFGWLAAHGDSPEDATLLAWGANPMTPRREFFAVMIGARALIDAAALPEAVVPDSYRILRDDLRESANDDVTPRTADEAEVLSTLAAFVEVMERRGDSNPATEPQEGSKAARRKVKSAPRANSRPVALVYARGVHGAPTVPSGRTRSTHRWPVRGFWRRQWYASLDEHRLIWINEHTRGPADAPMQERKSVHVIRREPDSSATETD